MCAGRSVRSDGQPLRLKSFWLGADYDKVQPTLFGGKTVDSELATAPPMSSVSGASFPLLIF